MLWVFPHAVEKSLLMLPQLPTLAKGAGQAGTLPLGCGQGCGAGVSPPGALQPSATPPPLLLLDSHWGGPQLELCFGGPLSSPQPLVGGFFPTLSRWDAPLWGLCGSQPFSPSPPCCTPASKMISGFQELGRKRKATYQVLRAVWVWDLAGSGLPTGQEQHWEQGGHPAPLPGAGAGG